jgi:hypothetical protein
MTVTETTTLIENHIADGDTEKAVQLLLALTEDKPDEIRQETILLASQYREATRNETLGLATDTKDINRIHIALLQLNSRLESQYGLQKIDTQTTTLARRLEDAEEVIYLPVRKAQKYRGILLGVLGIVVFAVAYFMFQRATADTVISSPSVFPSQNEPELPYSTTNQVVYIDKKAKFRNLELLETRYYPTDGEGILEFDFNYDCPPESSGGCGVGNQNIQLRVGDKTYMPEKILLNEGASTLFLCNTDGLLTVRFAAIPQGTKAVALLVSEALFSVLNPMVNPMTLNFDLNQTLKPAPKPPLRVLETARDLGIQKNFGSVQILSVQALPYSNKHIALNIHFKRRLETDFYGCCLRVLADKRRIGATEKISAQDNQTVEATCQFVLPSSSQNVTLMVGNCKTGNPTTMPITPFY